MFSRYAHTLTHKVLITAVILTVYEHLKDCFCESCSARDELHFIPPLKQTMLLFVSFVFLFCSCSGGFCLFFANAILGNRCLPRTMCQTASTQEGMSESSPFFPPKSWERVCNLLVCPTRRTEILDNSSPNMTVRQCPKQGP